MPSILRSAELRPVTIQDFTPGIADDPGFNYPPGQAQRAGTFACVSNPSGALVPGPANVNIFGSHALEASTPPTNYVVDGIYATGPVVDTSQAVGTFTDFKEVFVAVEYAINVGAGVGDKKINISRLQLYEPGNPYQTIKASTFVGVADYATQWGVTFAESRSNRASPTTVGVPVVYINWSRQLTTGSFLIEFPDDQNATSVTPFTVLSNTQVGGVYSHQGRAVLALLTNYNHGPSTIWNTSENLQWTAPNDCTNANLSAIQQFYPERSDGYCDIASMSANELFLLKQSGAIMASGDLNSALIQNLPMAAGGGVFSAKGTRTRAGYIYLSVSSGAWLWQHGDGSTHLSPKLKPGFWLPNDGAENGGSYTYVGGTVPVASCYSEGKYAYLPNNWMYDTDTRAWWRLDDPSIFSARWISGAQSSIFLAQTHYTNAAGNFLYEYDVTVPQSGYSWTSHPLMETVDRRVEVREVVIRARGTGTIAVTVTSENNLGGTGTQTATFTMATTATSPQIFRQNFNVVGDNIFVKVVSNGTGGTPVAPTLYELTLMVRDAQMTRTG